MIARSEFVRIWTRPLWRFDALEWLDPSLQPIRIEPMTIIVCHGEIYPVRQAGLIEALKEPTP